MVEIQAEVRVEMPSLERELSELWKMYEEYKAARPELEIKCRVAIDDFRIQHGAGIEDDRVDWGVERMMVAAFALDLAEKQNEAVRLKVDDRQKEIVVINDTEAKTKKNEFAMGISLLRDGRLELWFDVAMIMRKPVPGDNDFDRLPQVSKNITNREIVFWCSHAWEEYAHMAFDAYKPGPVLREDMKNERVLGKEAKREPDEDRALALRKAQGSEYRGTIWMATFMRKYFPSFESNWPKVTLMAGEIRRERNIWP